MLFSARVSLHAASVNLLQEPSIAPVFQRARSFQELDRFAHKREKKDLFSRASRLYCDIRREMEELAVLNERLLNVYIYLRSIFFSRRSERVSRRRGVITVSAGARSVIPRMNFR